MKKKILFISATLLLLAGCTEIEQPDVMGLVPISLTATVEGDADATTRAGTSLLNEFSNGDVLGIALTNSVNSSGAALSATTYTVGTGFASQPYIQVGQTATIKGYYPSSAASATSFSVQGDQTSDDNYKLSDLMFAASQNATKASPSPTLTFVHKMAKLIVTVTSDGTIDGLTITGVTVKGMKKTIGFTSATGALGASSTLADAGDITMTNGGACLFPPQDKTGDFVVVETNKGTSIFTLGETKSFVSGYQYTLNLSIGAESINHQATITGWEGTQGSINVSPIAASALEIDNIAAVTYNGSAWTPSVTVRLNNVVIDNTANDKYDVSYYNNTNAGQATVLVTGKGTYAGQWAKRTFTINKKTLEYGTDITQIMSPSSGEYNNCMVIAAFQDKMNDASPGWFAYMYFSESGKQTGWFKWRLFIPDGCTVTISRTDTDVTLGNMSYDYDTHIVKYSRTASKRTAGGGDTVTNTYNITITGGGNYTGSFSFYFSHYMSVYRENW